jgi:hypothetical protein
MEGKSLGLSELCRLNAPFVVWLMSSKRKEALRMNASELFPFGRGRSIPSCFWLAEFIIELDDAIESIKNQSSIK